MLDDSLVKLLMQLTYAEGEMPIIKFRHACQKAIKLKAAATYGQESTVAMLYG